MWSRYFFNGCLGPCYCSKLLGSDREFFLRIHSHGDCRHCFALKSGLPWFAFCCTQEAYFHRPDIAHWSCYNMLGICIGYKDHRCILFDFTRKTSSSTVPVGPAARFLQVVLSPQLPPFCSNINEASLTRRMDEGDYIKLVTVVVNAIRHLIFTSSMLRSSMSPGCKPASSLPFAHLAPGGCPSVLGTWAKSSCLAKSRPVAVCPCGTACF